jgi:DNA excision repair protein ERCC-4
MPNNEPPPFVIAVDTREQQPYAFTGLATERKTLKTADYSIVGLEDKVAVERKSKGDAWGCMAESRARFERCLVRLAELDRALVVIECSLPDFCDRPPQIQRVTVASAVGGFISAMVRHRVPVIWAGDRAYAERVTVRFLASYWKHRRDA